jgi:hypothetical protein
VPDRLTARQALQDLERLIEQQAAFARVDDLAEGAELLPAIPTKPDARVR